MTWLKLSDDFSDQCARAGLSDAGYRMHVEGLGWCMRRETGGHLSERDVLRCAETGDPADAVRELLGCGFWTREGSGYRVLHHMDLQDDPELIAQRRKNATQRMREYRRRQAGLSDDHGS